MISNIKKKNKKLEHDIKSIKIKMKLERAIKNAKELGEKIKTTKRNIDIKNIIKKLENLKTEIKRKMNYTNKIYKIKTNDTKHQSKIIKKNTKDQFKKINLRVMNVNGLNHNKYMNIEEEFFRNENEINIVCLTETHEKCEETDIHQNIKAIHTIREKNDKRGGGILLLTPNMTRINLKEIKNKNKELLEAEGNIFDTEVKIITVYFDANRDQNGRDRNTMLQEIIEDKIQNNTKEGLIITGDFNGHIKDIDNRDTDKNGKMILDWIENYDLILLNTDQRCEGVFTRIRNEQKTTIDYVLVNREMYDKFEKMHIDEEKEIIPESDHNLLSVTFRTNDKQILKKAKWHTNTYYSMKEADLKTFTTELKNKWENTENKNMQERLKDIEEIAEKNLKRVARRKIGGEKKFRIADKIWMNDEIRNEMKLKSQLNRRKRYGKNHKEKEQLMKKWINKKNHVQKLIRDAKSKYEIDMTKKMKEKSNRGKDVWKNINKISGRDQKEDESIEVYENNKKLSDEEAEKNRTAMENTI